MNYAISHNGQAFTPDGKADINDVSAHNVMVTEAELAAWACQPNKWFAYVKLYNPEKLGMLDRYGKITTWTGETLGKITRLGHEYHDNFGGKRRNISVKGTNGINYHGIWYSDWDYCRLTAYRHQ